MHMKQIYQPCLLIPIFSSFSLQMDHAFYAVFLGRYNVKFFQKLFVGRFKNILIF